MQLIAYNLIALAVYTIMFRFLSGGIIFDALVIAIHLFTCFIMALAKRSWYWVLSGVMVLAIGFSTCAWMGSSMGLN
jgi:hypothetical protein